MAGRKRGQSGSVPSNAPETADESGVAGVSQEVIDMRMAMFQIQVQENIEKFGWHVNGIFAVEPGDIPFSYSVGAHTRGLPEVVVTGLNPNSGAALINTALKLAEAGEKLEEGVDYTEIANMPVRFKRVTEASASEHMTMAISYAKALKVPFEALQMVYPDPKGRFPWDEGYDFPRQELLYPR